MSFLSTAFDRGIRATVPSYEAAAMTRRLSNWVATNLGPNTLIAANGETLRRRSRDACRNNNWASRALDILVSEIVGLGMTPRFGTTNASLKREVQDLWFWSTDEMDYYGVQDFYGLQSAALRAVIQDGEVFVRIRKRRTSDGLLVPIKFQLLECDHLPLTKNETLPNGNRIINGIEFNAINERVAYWMYREHPQEANSLDNFETVRVPAEEIAHVYRPKRPGLTRGEPWLTPVLVRLRELDECEDATLARMKVANMIAWWVTRPPDGTESENNIFNSSDDGNGVANIGVQPASTIFLQPGEEVTKTDPPDPGGNYDSFVTGHLRGIAAPVNLPYPSLTGDYGKTSFSASRLEQLVARRYYQTIQHQVMAFQFCRPLARAWVDMAILSGALGNVAPRRAEELRRIRWNAHAWPWVDPQKDQAAAKTSVRCGWSTRSRIAAELGEDVEVIDEENAAENMRADRLGLAHDSDGRQPANGPSQAKSTGGRNAK